MDIKNSRITASLESRKGNPLLLLEACKSCEPGEKQFGLGCKLKQREAVSESHSCKDSTSSSSSDSQQPAGRLYKRYEWRGAGTPISS